MDINTLQETCHPNIVRLLKVVTGSKPDRWATVYVCLLMQFPFILCEFGLFVRLLKVVIDCRPDSWAASCGRIYWHSLPAHERRALSPYVFTWCTCCFYNLVSCLVFLVFEFCQHDMGRLLDTMPRPFTHQEDLEKADALLMEMHTAWSPLVIFIAFKGILPSQVKSLMKQLLAAVDHCHQRWVMHRDIKMSNLVRPRCFFSLNFMVSDPETSQQALVSVPSTGRGSQLGKIWKKGR
eukprot:924742-Pelagomonas_calceolata.AAC.1